VAPNKQPGPAGQSGSDTAVIDDGTTARAESPTPAPTGSQGGTSKRRDFGTGACAYLNPVSSQTVLAPHKSFERLRGAAGKAAISATRPKDSFAWPHGAASAAVEQDVTIDGQVILVVRPTDAAAAGKNLPTTAQLAEALRALPAKQRALSKKVIVCPNPHTKSTANRTIAGDAGSGEITLFPVAAGQSQNDFDNRVMHESGHNYQETLWNSAAALGEWQLAGNSDRKRPSPYSAQNAGEDFSEFLILFNTARGTPCEATAQNIYPNRWAKMAEYQSR
jgi:hypothetical protein